jgi:hypothetical protein
MYTAGYILMQTMGTAGPVTIGFVVALLESTSKKLIQEHWFYPAGVQNEYPTTIGTHRTVTFQPFPLSAGAPWWTMHGPTNGVFNSGLFQQTFAPGSTQIVDTCLYQPMAEHR